MSESVSYTNALQTIALFGLNLHRFPAMIGPMAFFILYVRFTPSSRLRPYTYITRAVLSCSSFQIEGHSAAVRTLFQSSLVIYC